MTTQCPKCKNGILDGTGKCMNCGYKNIYKKRNIQSQNNTARHAALDAKKKSNESNNEKQIQVPIVEKKTQTTFTLKSNKSMNQEKKVVSKEIEFIQNKQIENKKAKSTSNHTTEIESNKENNCDNNANVDKKGVDMKSQEKSSRNTLLTYIRAKYMEIFSNERKIEKTIPINIDLNIDHYYDDVISSDEFYVEGIDLLTIIKYLAIVLGIISFIIFLIYWW